MTTQMSNVVKIVYPKCFPLCNFVTVPEQSHGIIRCSLMEY